jgi:AcrR family transcriptional regulator
MSFPAHTRRAPRLPAHVRREHILDAAIAVFARAGFRQATTAAIAAELGISEPTVFRHFVTKRALYLAALRRSTEVTMSRWAEIVAAAPSALAALLQMGQWYFAELQRDSQHLRLRFRSYSEASDPEVRALVRENVRTAFDFVHRLYESARAAGEIAPDTDVRAQTWLFVSIGTLLDLTQVLGMRDDLPLEVMPAIMRISGPRLGAGRPLREDT